jgi:SAM-dependent methyltransferase
MPPEEAAQPCPVCGAPTDPAGQKRGDLTGRDFALRRCSSCNFGFVADPWTDYARIYDEAYYRGDGADPLVDYVFEFDHPDGTVRQYEWRGIVRVVSALAQAAAGTKWLDYGCGTGGLVRYLQRNGFPGAVGFEEGWSVPRLREREVPLIERDQLAEHEGSFDVITAIEVIEHVADPVAELRVMRSLLRKGGLLFLTTGNARPHADALESWSYVRPEIHVSFFEPQTLATALELAGFEPAFPGWVSGWEEIIAFKVLKNLRLKRSTPLDRAVPWRPVGHLLDRRMALTAHPVGRAR